MPALAPALRRNLENTVVKARELAERGARATLDELDVAGNSHIASMTAEQERQRRRLRAHGRQLGDQAGSSKGSQSIERLVREMAYEHWHRMLFARFLAENHLLIEPTSGVAISLDECEELAAEEGTDLWGLAAQFAQAMLPQIFRTDDPVLAAKLPLEIRQQLQALVAGLEAETFTASDSLGWTYQFWQTKRKKEVNDSGVKIGADEISPVTQLFTEDYMVDFLLDNTLGAWHAGKVLAANPQLAATAQSEDELRHAVSLPGCSWTYLRLIQAETGSWAPAAGVFDGWPKDAAELKCIDPCMGSGHFVVGMFERLVALRLFEEQQGEEAAITAVIHGNLFGLEVDARCTQIAAFNLALAAWRHVGYCKLPSMNLACSGVAPNTSKAEWMALAGDDERLRNGMERLYQLFDKAEVLGSLIDPRRGEVDLLAAGFYELQPLLEQAIAREAKDELSHELSVAASGLTKAAKILASQFNLIATNVPYLGRGKQDEPLQSYCALTCPDAKSDLATSFLMRSAGFSCRGGTIALVTPQSWLYLASFKSLRKSLLKKYSWNAVVRLGRNAFQDMNFWAATTGLTIISKKEPVPGWRLCGLDLDHAHSQSDKASASRCHPLFVGAQEDQLNGPDSKLMLGTLDSGSLLESYCNSYQGIKSGDDERFRRRFWELPKKTDRWRFLHSTISGSSRLFGGMESLIDWEDDGAALARRQGVGAWGKHGVMVSQMNNLPVSIFLGDIFDSNASPIMPSDPSDLPAVFAFTSSGEYRREVRKIDQSIKATNSSLLQVPFDLEHWRERANELYPDGLPKPFSSSPTQWLFSGHPSTSDQPLHAAVARLVGYQWPRQTSSGFPDCPALGPDGLESLADGDGIVCLSPVRGEASAADRLRGLLAEAFGDEWSNAKERELLLEVAVANDTKKPAADLGDWLRQNFFAEHCKLFQSRPFIWQIWDGNPHGFSALVNYHNLAAPNGQARKTLEQLTYTYLGDWIDRQKLDQAEGVNGADDRLAAALNLQGQLNKILDGEPPYDLFVRWKPLHQQAIGWDPDINDGVRLNIRPFLNAQLRKSGKAGAGILRAKPGTIKWAKDRGKEPLRSKEEFPWFWGWEENKPALASDFGAPIPAAPPAGDSFDGNRWNDLHYTRAAKDAARARQAGGKS